MTADEIRAFWDIDYVPSYSNGDNPTWQAKTVLGYAMDRARATAQQTADMKAEVASLRAQVAAMNLLLAKLAQKVGVQ